jgi:hypothetical protein
LINTLLAGSFRWLPGAPDGCWWLHFVCFIMHDIKVFRFIMILRINVHEFLDVRGGNETLINTLVAGPFRWLPRLLSQF